MRQVSLKLIDVQKKKRSAPNKFLAKIANLLIHTREQQWYINLMDEQQYVYQESINFEGYPYPEALNVCTADAIIVNPYGEVCFIRRKGHPCKGMLALVGGHKENDETFLECAIREAGEEICVLPEKLQQTGTPIICDNPNRDLSFVTKVSIAYLFGLGETEGLTAADDADSIEWIKWEDIPKRKHEIAFDHFDIVQQAFEQKTYLTYL